MTEQGINDLPSARGYDQLAPWYQLLERLAFGGALEQGRDALLDQVSAGRQTLILGDGDGRFLEAFLRTYPVCDVTSIDFSEEMIERQRRRAVRLDAAARVQWQQANLTEMAYERSRYDLVVTIFVLDCFTSPELEQLIPRISSAIKPGGQWYYVDFQMPQHGRWRRLRARPMLWAMHRFFRWQTDLQPRRLLDLGPLFQRNGWECAQRMDTNHGFITSRLYRR